MNNKPRLLLIDDEKDFHTSFKQAFENFFDIRSAYSFSSAKTMIEGATFFQLILLDLHLSNDVPDGIALIEFIKSKTRTPVIVVSNEGNDAALKLDVKNHGVDKYLVKNDFDLKLWLEIFRGEVKQKKDITVFLSHSSKDRGFVGWLKQKLSNNGFSVFLNPIKPGAYIFDALAEKVGESDYLILIISTDSNSSKWVRQELNDAINLEINGKLKRVIPVTYYPCEIPTGLQSRKILNFYDTYESFNSELKELFETLI